MTTTLTDGTTIATALSITGWSLSQDSGNIVQSIIGSPVTVDTLRPAGPRTGTIALAFDDAAAAETCRQLLASPAKLTLSDDIIPAANLDLILNAGGRITVELSWQDQQLWTVTADIKEVTP